MGHDTFGVNGENRRYGDAIPWRVFGKGLIDQIELDGGVRARYEPEPSL